MSREEIKNGFDYVYFNGNKDWIQLGIDVPSDMLLIEKFKDNDGIITNIKIPAIMV